jgi:hypothetical protein
MKGEKKFLSGHYFCAFNEYQEWEEATFYILHNQNGPPARNCPMAFDAWLEGTDSAGNPVSFVDACKQRRSVAPLPP